MPSPTLTTIAKFTGTNGFAPAGSMVLDAAGNLFGVTFGDGDKHVGSVYEVVAGTHALVNLKTFNGSNGDAPATGLISDAAGNMYGVTIFGGESDAGVLFKVDAHTHAVTTLINFDDTTTGSQPLDLTVDTAGNIFGVSHLGGAGGAGIVYEIAAATGAFSTVHAFDGSTDGYG